MKLPDLADDMALDYNELGTLKHLARAGAAEGDVSVTSNGLARELHVSAQTVSRRLQRLEELDLLRRKHIGNGQLVSVTARGVETLKHEFEAYRDIFHATLEFRGAVTTGLGEGAHFVAMEGYLTQFRTELGYEPYHGTLNLDLEPESVGRRTLLAARDRIDIEGWADGDRTFGPVYCYPATVSSESAEVSEAHVVVPERTTHDEDELELIAPMRLREELDVSDGDDVTVRVT